MQRLKNIAFFCERTKTPSALCNLGKNCLYQVSVKNLILNGGEHCQRTIGLLREKRENQVGRACEGDLQLWLAPPLGLA